MRVFIYGFKNLGKEQDVTEHVVAAIRDLPHVQTNTFHIKFSQKMLLDEIKRVKPDVIIGLAQHPRGKKLRVERRALNQKRDAYDTAAKKIAVKGPDLRRSTLHFPRSKKLWYSYKPGRYIGNYSMYVVAGYAQKNNIPFGFIHIPKNYNHQQAADYLRKTIKGFCTQTSLSNF